MPARCWLPLSWPGPQSLESEFAAKLAVSQFPAPIWVFSPDLSFQGGRGCQGGLSRSKKVCSEEGDYDQSLDKRAGCLQASKALGGEERC